MERYLQIFYRTKASFLEFHTAKATRAEGNRQDRDPGEGVANQRTNKTGQITAAKRRQELDQESLERPNQPVDLIRHQNNFNFITMQYLSHFPSHIGRFP